MLKKFIEGIVFGGGFTISFIALCSLSAYILVPYIIETQTQTLHETSVLTEQSLVTSDRRRFRNQTTEDKIKEATAIALVQFKPDDDGRMIGIITDILKHDPDAEFFYEKGEEHPPSSFYPDSDQSYGSGSIVFFTGSPARMQLSAYFFGDRIPMLNDVSLPSFIEMCKKEQA